MTTVLDAPTVPAQRVEPTAAALDSWALTQQAQRDTAAFGDIYRRYSDSIFRFIYFRVGNKPLAEDLTHDTFVRALRNLHRFEWQGKDFGAWLTTIARNLVADHFKSGRYRLEVTTGDVLDADREDRDRLGMPEAAALHALDSEELARALTELNPEQRLCLELRFFDGLSVAETADAMGKNEGAVKALQYRAVRAMARALPDGFVPA